MKSIKVKIKKTHIVEDIEYYYLTVFVGSEKECDDYIQAQSPFRKCDLAKRELTHSEKLKYNT